MPKLPQLRRKTKRNLQIQGWGDFNVVGEQGLGLKQGFPSSSPLFFIVVNVVILITRRLNDTSFPLGVAPKLPWQVSSLQFTHSESLTLGLS